MSAGSPLGWANAVDEHSLDERDPDRDWVGDRHPRKIQSCHKKNVGQIPHNPAQDGPFVAARASLSEIGEKASTLGSERPKGNADNQRQDQVANGLIPVEKPEPIGTGLHLGCVGP